jgi:2-iminobutanoate/2-iminopropanoate deaminase
MQSGQKVTTFHLGPWEEEIGYSQSVRVGNRILVSGTAADDTVFKDLESQLKDIYQSIMTTLAHDGASLKNVIKETIYCRDMEALIKCQHIRKKFYEGHLPAATWVQIEKLYAPGHWIEIEVEAMVFDQ